MTPRRSISILLLILDVVAVITAFNLISVFRGLGTDRFVIEPLLLPIAAVVFAIYLIEGYKAHTDMLSVDYTSQHAIALLSAMVATLLYAFVFVGKGTDFELHASRLVVVLSFVALIPVTLGYRRLIYLRLTASRENRSLVFLGDRASCEAFRAEYRKMEMTQDVIYCVVSDQSAAPFRTTEEIVLRPFEEVLRDLRENRLRVEAIVLRETARELPVETTRELVQLYYAGVPTYTLELFHEVYWRKIPIYRLNQTWLFQEGFRIAREPVFERIKRATDILLSLIVLTIAAPIILLAALAILLDGGGPVFFRQMRIGKNHKPFPLLKLRTMRPSKSTDDLYTQPGDARITRVGKYLRATRLDELPQLWNVFCGDMSLIGPRAEWDRLVETYERDISCYHFRHFVKPGITGWAQVNYPYGANLEDTVRKLEYDLYYIRHFSFLLDATIVLKTIHIMLFGKGR